MVKPLKGSPLRRARPSQRNLRGWRRDSEGQGVFASTILSQPWKLPWNMTWPFTEYHPAMSWLWSHVKPRKRTKSCVSKCRFKFGVSKLSCPVRICSHMFARLPSFPILSHCFLSFPIVSPRLAFGLWAFGITWAGGDQVRGTQSKQPIEHRGHSGDSEILKQRFNGLNFLILGPWS